MYIVTVGVSLLDLQPTYPMFKGLRGLNTPSPEVIIYVLYLTQLSMKFSLLINMKLPTIVGIFIFISRETSV